MLDWLFDSAAVQPVWNGLLATVGASTFEFPFYFMVVVVAVVIVTGIYFSILDTVVYNKIPAKTAWRDGILIMGGYIAAVVGLYATHHYYAPWVLAVPETAPSMAAIILQVSIFMVLGEFLTYWWHRLEHGSRFVFTHVHYMHHSVDNPLTIWTNFVVHPVEGIMVLLCLYIAPALYGAHPMVWIAYAAANTTAMVITHSGYDFKFYPGWLLPRASGHELHHSEKRPTNLSVVMSYGDKLFGTYKAPETLQ